MRRRIVRKNASLTLNVLLYLCNILALRNLCSFSINDCAFMYGKSLKCFVINCYSFYTAGILVFPCPASVGPSAQSGPAGARRVVKRTGGKVAEDHGIGN